MKRYVRGSRKPSKQDLIAYYNQDGGRWSSTRRYKATTMPRYSVLVSSSYPYKLRINENYNNQGWLNFYLPTRFDICVFETNNKKAAQAYIDNIEASESELISIIEDAVKNTGHYLSGPKINYSDDHIVIYYTAYENASPIYSYLLQDNRFSGDAFNLTYHDSLRGLDYTISSMGGNGAMPMLWITRPFKAIPMDYTKGYSLD
jgi:hypothetical protein